jgi:phosphoribosylamine--glycine ligase
MGIPVVGGGKFCDKLEKDRQFGTMVAEKAGCQIPPYEEFESLSECKKWAERLGDVEVYFKSDKFIDSDATQACRNGEDLIHYLDHLRTKTGDRTRCIVQQKIDGIAFSTAQWWNGKVFIGPYEHTIEHKKFMNDDVGPATGCSFNAIWFTPESTVAEGLGWKNLEPIFRENNAPPGLYDINAVVDKQGEAWFLEWTPRFGYDSEPTSFRLVSSLSDLFMAAALGSGQTSISADIGYSVRLSVSPYPWEYSELRDKKTCVGVPVRDVDGLWDGNFIVYELKDEDGELQMAASDGIIGLAYAQGDNLEKLHEEVIEFVLTIRCPGLQYRTDGAKVIMKDAEALQKSGVNVHPGLLGKKEEANAAVA